MMKTIFSVLKNTKNMLSKALASFSATVVLATTTLTPATTFAASTPFITKLCDGTGITFDESQLQATITTPSKDTYTNIMRIRDNFLDSRSVKTTPGKRMILILTVRGIDENSANKLVLYSTSSYNANNTTEKFAPIPSNPTSVEKISNDRYTITYNFESFGDTLTLETSPVSDIKSVRCVLKEDPNFLSVQIRAPQGYDSFVATVPKKSGVTNSAIKNWARNNCLFLNSLSDITGIKKNTVFVEFYGGGYCNNNKLDTSFYDKYSFVSLDTNATNAIISYWKSWNENQPPVMIQEELHEYAHVYSLDYEKYTSESTSPPGYDSEIYSYNNEKYRRNNFSNFYNMNADDIFTNVRGITAIQHCYNLRNKLYLSSTNKKGEAHTYCKYDTFLQEYLEYIDTTHRNWREAENVVNDYRAHWFNATIAKITVERNAWEPLKLFFKGEAPSKITDDVYKDFGIYLFGNNSTKFKGINWDLSDKISYPSDIVRSEEKVKLVNTTYKLWQLFNYESEPNKYAFEAFLNNYFDKDLLRSFCNLNNSILV